jgi:hypothetical protein
VRVERGGREVGGQRQKEKGMYEEGGGHDDTEAGTE